MIERLHRNRLVTYITFESADDVHRFVKKNKTHIQAWAEYNKMGEVDTELFHELITVSRRQSLSQSTC